MSWVSVEERLPERPMQIEVLIEGERFLGESFYEDPGICRAIDTKNVCFSLDNPRLNDKSRWIQSQMDRGGGWIKAKYLKDVSHWIEIPETPK